MENKMITKTELELIKDVLEYQAICIATQGWKHEMQNLVPQLIEMIDKEITCKEEKN